MADQPTPAQLRAAADLLGQAALVEGYEKAAAMSEQASEEWPGSLIYHPIQSALFVLSDPRLWNDYLSGMRWLVQAVRLRLQVEAWALMRGDFAQPYVTAMDLLDGWLEETGDG